jgi:ribosomal protein L7Ae-like RNA K-turn-binding protein
MNNVLTLLGFAQKSGNLILGETSCEQGVERRKISLLIIAEDLGDSAQKKFIRLCEAQGVPYRVLSNKEVLSQAIGKSNYGLFGIANKKFTRALIAEIDAR